MLGRPIFSIKKFPSKQLQQTLPRKVNSTTFEVKVRLQIRSRSRSNEVKFSKFVFSSKKGSVRCIILRGTFWCNFYSPKLCGFPKKIKKNMVKKSNLQNFWFSPKKGLSDAEFYGDHFGVLCFPLNCIIVPKIKFQTFCEWHSLSFWTIRKPFSDRLT